MSGRTVLIGLDGATFTILNPLMKAGVMPFLSGLAERGVSANLRSIVPALTPPAWTSLMTGRTPGYHGVFDFFQPESADSRYLRFASASDVSSETIWSILSRQGRTITALNFPLMFPPSRSLKGYVVPGGWMPWKQLRLACHPTDLYDRLKSLPGFNARELAMDMAVEEKAIEGCREDEYEDWITFHVRREEHWFEIVKYLMTEDPSDLTAVLFDGVDKLQHLCWIYLDPTYADAIASPRQQAIRELCLGYFRHLDTIMQNIVEMAGPDATVVIASDHGFGPNYEVFYINSWLEQNGYLAWAQGHDQNSGDAILGMTDLTRYIYRLDWSRTTAYAATPSSNGIHIVKATEPGAPGVPPEDYERFRAELIAKLRTVTEPATGEQIVTDIWTREEAFPGPRGEIGPDLTLVLCDGGLVSILPAPDGIAVQPRQKHSGAHRPEGVFMAAGPGIQSGIHVAELSILDVAPTLLYSVGLPVPKDMEGRMPEEIIEPACLEQHPVEYVAAREHDTVSVPAEATPNDVSDDGATVHTVFDADAEAAVMARLRALGYVE